MIDPMVLVRGIHFAATLLVAGTVSFTVLVAAPSRRIAAMLWAALVLTILSGAVWLALIASNILEMPVREIGAADFWNVVTGIRFGQVAGLRLGFTVVLAALLAVLPQQRALQLVAAAALAGGLALVGHAGATPGALGWLHLTSDLIHILAACAWLGGLPALAITLSGPPDRAVTATHRFSVLGMGAVAALLLSGVINSWLLLGGPADLIDSAYGRVLLIKIVLFAAMVAVAAVNRLWLTPRLPRTVSALRRNSVIETALGFALLLLVGALGTMIPGGHVHTNAAPSDSEAAFVHIHTEQVMADVTIDPGQNRRNSATIRLSREDSSDYPAGDVKLSIESRDDPAQKREGTASRGPDGTWQVENLAIPQPGVWLLRLTITDGTSAPISLDAPIVIMQCSNECW